jgi:hypothetical protein
MAFLRHAFTPRATTFDLQFCATILLDKKNLKYVEYGRVRDRESETESDRVRERKREWER